MDCQYLSKTQHSSSIFMSHTYTYIQGTPKLLTDSQLTDLWERIDARVEELLEGCEPLPDRAIPFDAASDVPVEEQKYMYCSACLSYSSVFDIKF